MATSGMGLFVRPRNMQITTMLQSLSIVASLGRKSGGKVTHISSPREPYAQRLLSFVGVFVDDLQTVRSLSSQANYYVGLTSRADLSHSTLNYELPMEERGISLADVASIVGFRMADRSTDFTEVSGVTQDKNSQESNRFSYMLDCQIDRRHTPARPRPSSKSVTMEVRNRRRLVDAVNEFGGFSGNLHVRN